MTFKHPYPIMTINLDDVEKIARVKVEIPIKNKEEVLFN